MLLSRKDRYGRILIAVDISILDKSSIKIRFRHAVFVVDPAQMGSKVNSDAIVLFNGKSSDFSRVVDYRVIIRGAGEYEINGVKIVGIRIDNGFVYNIIGDGLGMVLGKTKEVSKISAKGGVEFSATSQIAVLNVDSEFTQAIVTGFEPKVVLLYGDNKEMGLKNLATENLAVIKKFTVTKDNLPEEMEVVVLG